MTDSPRIIELRRRVQADPASIAFAQLGEECRRAGANDEAVAICRNGLATHPGYLSARITLGRALIELGELDDARRELEIVVETAPDNLAANRGLAEIAQQQGRMSDALTHYKHALTLASHDAELEDSVDRISLAIAPPPPGPSADVPAVAVEELFDFDKLLAELGEPAAQEQPAPPAPPIAMAPLEVPAVLRPTGGTDLEDDDGGEFAAIERELRALDERRAKDDQAAREQRALEEQRRREQEEQQLRELEEQRLKEAEEQRLRDAEEQRLRDAEERRLKAAEEQRARELEAQRRREAEEQRRRELEQALEEEQRLLEEQRLRAVEEERLKKLQRLQEEETARRRREQEEQRARDAEAARRQLARRRQEAAVNGLERWLSAIVADRDHHSSL